MDIHPGPPSTCAAVSREMGGRTFRRSPRVRFHVCFEFSPPTSSLSWKHWCCASVSHCLLRPFFGFSGRVFKYPHDCLRWLIRPCFSLDSFPRPRHVTPLPHRVSPASAGFPGNSHRVLTQSFPSWFLLDARAQTGGPGRRCSGAGTRTRLLPPPSQRTHTGPRFLGNRG